MSKIIPNEKYLYSFGEEDKPVILHEDTLPDDNINLKSFDIDNLLKILSDMRYRPILAGKDEIVRIQKGVDNYSDYLRRNLINNHEALFYIDVRNDDIIMLFMVKNILIQLSPLAIQISKPYKILKYSSKKECEICNESRTKFFPIML